MSEQQKADLIHISEIDEYLAARVIGQGGVAIGRYLEKSGDEGFLMLTDTESLGDLMGESVDFELSPSEYLNLEETELKELLAMPLVTSSAFELFDFLLLNYDSFSFVAEFTGHAWKIQINTI